MHVVKVEKRFLMFFKSGIFPLPLIEDAGLKISNPEEMFQGLPVALAYLLMSYFFMENKY